MNLDKIFLQKQYIDYVSTRLEQYSVQTYAPYKANFRCEICGDSQKNKFKKRGYILEKSEGIFYFCHNCGYNKSFDSYMKERQYDLFKQYWVEVIRSRNQEDKPKPKVEKKVEPEPVKSIDYLEGLTDVLDLDNDHPCIEYLVYRQFPDFGRGQFYYTDTFYQYINSIVPGKIKDYAVKTYEHSRLVFPLKTEQGKVYGVNARAFDEQSTRYLSIKFEDHSKIYGLEKLDRSQHCHVVEGPIDSLFLPNCLALAGTDGDISLVFKDNSAFTMVLDNQPRNAEVIGKYSKYISMGYNIVLWPENIKEKDINAMIMAGKSQQYILAVIKENTYRGLKAQINFNKWKKLQNDYQELRNKGDQI